MEDPAVDNLAGDVLVPRDPGPHVGVGSEKIEDGLGRPENLHPVVAVALNAGMKEEGKVSATEDRFLFLQFFEGGLQPAVALGPGGEAVLARGGQHEEGQALDPDYVVAMGGEPKGEVEVFDTGPSVSFVVANDGVDGDSGSGDEVPEPGEGVLVSGVEGVSEEEDGVEEGRVTRVEGG